MKNYITLIATILLVATPIHYVAAEPLYSHQAIDMECVGPCKVKSIFYVRPSDQTGNSDKAVGAKICTDNGLMPIDAIRVWAKGGGQYGTRHWMALCSNDITSKK
ncbi:MAG: hypothetical protein ABL911_05775 [Gallionella sp.]|nr:hypothetical protein [Gallionella sp.]